MVKHYLLALLLAASFAAQAQTGGVGIGTTTPAASAVLDVTSTSKGLLPPRMTQVQRDAIASPATGLTIYNTTTNKLNTWNGTSWDASLSTTEQPGLPGTSVIFNYSGGVQTYTVPAGVFSIQVDATGASGGDLNLPDDVRGLGARVQATLPVTPGQVLALYVGGAGQASNPNFTGGFNGGGNSSFGGTGGGATDIRTVGGQLTDRLLVAGGGAGAGVSAAFNSYSQGGAGGAPTGTSGRNWLATGNGTGGTLTAGGAAGAYGAGSGSLGTGGKGSTQDLGGGGGGGGGYYGGGGGAFSGRDAYNNPSSAAGGGGSSWVTPSGTGVVMTAGYHDGNGSLTLTPGPAYASPVLNGANIVNVPGTWTVSGNNVYRSGGNVGIGTSSPGHPLTVQAGVASNNPLLGFYSQAGADKYNFSLDGGGLNLSESGVAGARLFVKDGGNVGIGTPYPNQRLDVEGGIRARGSGAISSQGAYLQWNRSSGLGETWLLNQQGSGSGGIFFGKSDQINNATEWARFDGNGNLGIGTAPVDGAKLQVNGIALVGGGTVPNTSNATGLGWNAVNVNAGESELYNYRGLGSGGFRFFSVAGTGTPSASNDIAFINGSTGVYTTLSDRRVKTNIVPLGQGLRTVMALRPVSYDFHTSRRLENGQVTFLPDDKPVRALGFVAQDLLHVVPEAVEKPADERQAFYTVSYTTLVPVLAQAMQEQQAQIEELKKQNAALQARVATAETTAAQATATLETFEARLRRLEAGSAQAQR